MKNYIIGILLIVFIGLVVVNYIGDSNPKAYPDNAVTDVFKPKSEDINIYGTFLTKDGHSVEFNLIMEKACSPGKIAVFKDGMSKIIGSFTFESFKANVKNNNKLLLESLEVQFSDENYALIHAIETDEYEDLK